MKQWIKIGAAIFAVTALFMTGVAVAQADDPATDTSTVEDDRPSADLRERAGHRQGHGGRRMGRWLHHVAESLGITGRELRTELQSGATLAEIAEANGSSADELVSSAMARVADRLTQAVADGLDPARAEQITARLQEKLDEFVHAAHPVRSARRDHLQHRVRAYVFVRFAEAFEMTPRELLAALADATIPELAADAGVDVDAAVADIAAEFGRRLDQAVANGRITAEAAAEHLERFTQALRDRLGEAGGG